MISSLQMCYIIRAAVLLVLNATIGSDSRKAANFYMNQKNIVWALVIFAFVNFGLEKSFDNFVVSHVISSLWLFSLSYIL